jgi:hypothetical protein
VFLSEGIVNVYTYSGQGVASLTHYGDGRWALTGVKWGSELDLSGNIEVL